MDADRRPVFRAGLSYKDPRAALEWLESAFGFETTLVVTDAEDAVTHAEMGFAGGAIMIGPEWEGPQLGPAKMRSPASLGGAGTHLMWVTLGDGLDAHCERARAAGARIVQEPEDQFYGERTYRALDPEGHVWCFGQEVRVVSRDQMEQASGLKIEGA